MKTRFRPRLLALALLAVGCAGAAPAEDAPVLGPTGLRDPTPAEEAWMRQHFPVIKRIRLNAVALERVNRARRAKGLAALAEPGVRLAPLGQEAVTEGAGAETTSDFQFLADGAGAAADNSAHQAFPPVGNQGSIGSCVSFACTYYQFSYENALARGWNARSGDTWVYFSPKWTYNMVNGGADAGSFYSSTYAVLLDHGCATWAEFPYDSNYRAWCLSGDAWRHALEFRPESQGSIHNSNADTFISSMKAHLTNGHVAVISTYVYSWVQKTVKNDPATPDDDAFANQKIAGYMKNTNSGGHGMCVVGFNDNIWCDLNGDNIVDAAEKGAFKIVNSWGAGDWNSGFRWVAYDAVRVPSAVPGTASWPPTDRSSLDIFRGKNAYTLTARAAYAPKLAALFTVRHAKRSDMTMKVGKGGTSATTPSTTDTPSGLSGDGGQYAFDGSTTACDGSFALDLTDLSPPVGSAQRYFLGMQDATSTTSTGEIKSMTLQDVWAGNVTVGTITPAANPGNFNPSTGIANGSTAWCWVEHTFSSTAPPPTVTVLAADTTAAELGAATGSFTLARRDSQTGAPLSAGDLSVNLAFSGSATNGTDYQALPTNVSIPAGASEVTLTVTPLQDTLVEGNETVQCAVAGGAGYLPSGAATLTITDDDSRITVAASDATASEPGSDTGNFRFTRSGGTGGALTVYYSVAGSAAAGTDYQALSGSVSFGSGGTQANVTLRPLDDAEPELDETVLVTVTANAGYAVGSPGSATVTILANDIPTPTVSSVSPETGTAAGGTSVTVAGTGFSPVGTVAVLFDAAAATDVVVLGAGLLSCRTPAHSAGTVPVTVTNPGGLSGVRADAYTYAGLAVSSVSPCEGRMAGGDAVTVTGSGFANGATVGFGAEAGTSVVVLNATQLSCVVPAHPAGLVDVTVHNPGGASATLPGAFTFHGLEGDVAPRAGGGDDDIATTDLSQQRLFVANTETPASGPEFQKADVSPRSPDRGDGIITATDLSQMRLYVSSNDPLTEAGGPCMEGGAGTGQECPAYRGPADSAREVRVAGTASAEGGAGWVVIELDSPGDVTALSFTLSFDPAALRYLRAWKGAAARAGAFTLTLNEALVARGRLGVVLDSDAPFEAGAREVLCVQFVAADHGPGASATTLDFAHRAPTALGLANVRAEELGAVWTPATFSLLLGPFE